MGLKLGGGGGPVRETYPPLPVFPSSNSLLLLSSSLWPYPRLHTLNLHETIFQPGFKFTIFLFPNSPACLDVEASLGPADPAATGSVPVHVTTPWCCLFLPLWPLDTNYEAMAELGA